MQAEASSPAPRRWYVIHCKPRQEGRALENLVRQGFVCFLPKLSVRRPRNGRDVMVEESLFPGYLFINLDASQDNWAPIRSTRGVGRILRVGDRPLPVSDAIIESIRRRVAAQSPEPRLQPGERVVITDGCFAQLEAIFIAEDGDHRVTLLLNLLHQEHSLSFPAASVRRCAGA
jgi:transcriptional antiterminator RfaH